MRCDKCGFNRTAMECTACESLEFLGFCGCGDPDGTGAWLLAELETIRYPQTPAEYFIAYQFDNLELLTDKGKQVVAWLKEGRKP